MDDMWLSLTWKSYFIMFLHRCEAMDHDDSSFKKIEVLSDAELVEATIGVLCNAVEYNLRYKGNYSRIDRDETECDESVFEIFNCKRRHVEVAHEKEHAIVHVFGQCRKKDDKE